MVQNIELTHTLTHIGLTEKEAQVYLALLELESGTAYQIALECDVKKPTVYVILEDLRKKGLVLKVPHAKKALFSANDLGDYIKEREDNAHSARSLLPKLRLLGSHTKPQVFFFNGLKGIQQAIEHKFESMRGKEFKSFYGSLVGCSKEIIALYDEWDRKAVDAEISFRIITPDKEHNAHYKEINKLSETHTQNVQMKFLKEYEYPSNISFEIGEDFVRTIDAKNLQATIMDDKATADAMRQIFEIVWEKGA